ncbi:gastric inhibitory polypeptide isoform X1 [Pleurodeles waltl]|uniref:gastric inhibitory polypeptide isoform X1 n=1 Tax=Pleurodeles waltl TaxID=8319 RepID=UPI003709B185
MMSLKVLLLIFACLSLAMSETERSNQREVVNTLSTHSLERRYAEGTLASDYSRVMDSMLKKNFVEWLLSRREKKSGPRQEPSKREAGPQNAVAISSKEGAAQTESQENKPFFAWLLRNMQKESFPADVKATLSQKILDFMVSEDLCPRRTE